MPIDIKVEEMPAGYNAAPVKVEKDMEVTLITRELVSSEDEENFRIKAVEGIPKILLSYIPKERQAELLPVDSMVAIMRKDSTATLYLNTIPNDLFAVSDAVSKRPWEIGEDITFDDIADIRKVMFKGITFPPDAGILMVFKAGSRRGFFYDLVPLNNENKPREFDIEKALAHFICYLSQQHLFQVEDNTWQHMFENGWFPFITLKVATREKIINDAKARLPLDNLLPTIADEVKANCEHLRKKIQKHSIFSDHSKLLEHALNEYLAEDYISSTAIIYQRIEGIMRSLHRQANTNAGNRPGQNVLAEMTIQARVIDQSGILLLPDRFLEYLKKVYFADFDRPNTPDTISRHSVGHGTAPQEGFNQKSATLGLLILDQISYFLPDES
jgi:hypothetical protein